MEHKILTYQQAEDFFAELYRGKHHIPGFKPKEYGHGYTVIHDRGDMATWDYNDLTRLVLMAHRDCIRASVEAHSKGKLRIVIWQRQGREGGMANRHPDIQTAISSFGI